jgi:hypothetical protein
VGWLGLLLFTAVAAFGLLVEKPYLSYGNVPFPVLNNPVVRGQPVHLMVMRCNTDTKRRSYLLSRTLISTTGGPEYVLPASAASIAAGCHTDISAANVIPPDVPPGRYYIEGLAEVNGTLRTFIVNWHSQPFDVH